MHMRHNVLCGLPGSAIYLHIVSQTAHLKKKQGRRTENVCFDILYKFCMKRFYF